MSAATVPLRDRLRQIAPERAERQTRLIAALNARALGERVLSARLADEADRTAATRWIRFACGDHAAHVAPIIVDGVPARTAMGGHAPDAAAAAALLGRIEPVLAALEGALGCALHPDAVDDGPATDALLLRLDVSASDGPASRLIAAVPASGPVGTSPLPPAPPAALASLRWRWHARLPGPAVAPARLAALAAGDMMLLGVRPPIAHIALPGRARPTAGRIDILGGRVIVQDQTDAPDAAAEALKLATVVEFDGATLTLAEAAALAPGSVLPLPGGGGTLAVRVTAGGNAIGSGELVAVGEGFGVLFTHVALADDARG